MVIEDSAHYNLNGKWLIAAAESLLEKVERGESTKTPLPGSAPPPSLIAIATAQRLAAVDAAETKAPAFEAVNHANGLVPAAMSKGYRVQWHQVPTCWERGILPKSFEGPVWFIRSFRLDDSFRQVPMVDLEFLGVSYFSTIWLNGERIGEHRGIWDAFCFDVTQKLREENYLAVEVYKPGNLFPISGSLAGFIPYVTTTFGGIWQTVRLSSKDTITIEHVFARLRTDENTPILFVSGHVRTTISKVSIEVLVLSPRPRPEHDEFPLFGKIYLDAPTDTEHIGDKETPLLRQFQISLNAEQLPRWSPEEPRTIEIQVKTEGAGGNASQTITTGLRNVGISRRSITLNNQPIYPRGVLHWLSYPDLVAPTPDEATIRQEIRKVQELGYSMIKLCLAIPPDLYFDIADQMGMLIWLELPMWMPHVDDEFRLRSKTEYRNIIRRVRNHPSIVMYTLGCELSSEADATFLRELYDLVKEETEAALIRDNSGSAECYGGVDLEFADFYDYHFYAEATSFTDLVDYFVPAWKPIKPLVFGEYCDSDTFRSISDLKKKSRRDFYWTHNDPVVNPQGIRWDYHVVTNEERIAALNIELSAEEISHRSRCKSLEYRKSIVEETRVHPFVSGYVITNIQDSPITTSGMLDDFGAIKFDPEVFREFNAPTVISVVRDRRRVWRGGGDRPQHQDPRVFSNHEIFRVHLIVSHGTKQITDARLTWELQTDTNEIVATGSVSNVTLIPGKPTTAAIATCQMWKSESPYQLRLRTKVFDENGTIASNSHKFWILPDEDREWKDLFVFDSRGVFPKDFGKDSLTRIDVDQLCGWNGRKDAKAVILTDWHPQILDLLDEGVPVLAMLDNTTNRMTEELPFFREAIPLVHDHPTVDEIPHGGYAGVMWSGVTPDRSLLPEVLQSLELGAPVPIVSRLDSRTSLLTYYAVELHGTRAPLLLTTFALSGNFGRTPQGLEKNVFGRYLLQRMLMYLYGSF